MLPNTRPHYFFYLSVRATFISASLKKDAQNYFFSDQITKKGVGGGGDYALNHYAKKIIKRKPGRTKYEPL